MIDTIRTYALVYALGITLTGCFGDAKLARVSSDYAANIKSVGVVSLLSPGVNISHLGTSALESHFATVIPADWNSDRLVYDALIPRFQRKGYTVRELPRSPVLASARESDWRAPSGDNSVAEAVYALGESAGLDMVVVVQAQVSEDFVTGTNQKVRGYGLQQAFDTGPFLYATLLVEAYDIKKRFRVARAEANQVQPAAAGLWDPHYASARGTVTVSDARGAALSAALDKLVRETLGIAMQEAAL